MAERIINITCPNCKHGIKHDTLMNTTHSIAPEDYPELTNEGKAWCKRCQHGTFPNEYGLCSECIEKGRETRLRPETESKPKEKEEVKETIEETLEETPVLTTESLRAGTSVKPKKVKKTKVLR